MKNKIFLDDKRSFEEPQKFGYQCVRNYSHCTIMLDIYKNDLSVLNLDFDLGTPETGLDILIYMEQNNIVPDEIIIHSTHETGVKKMEKKIKQSFPHSKYSYCPYEDK